MTLMPTPVAAMRNNLQGRRIVAERATRAADGHVASNFRSTNGRMPPERN